MIYTIIGYKSNGTDSVMGCVQDRVDSDFDIESFHNSEDAANYYAKLIMEPDYSQYMAHSWEITILFNGQEDQDFHYDADNDYEEIPEHIRLTKNFDKLCNEAITDIEKERKLESDRKLEQKRKDREEDRLKKAIDKESSDRELLATLKEKYE